MGHLDHFGNLMKAAEYLSRTIEVHYIRGLYHRLPGAHVYVLKMSSVPPELFIYLLQYILHGLHFIKICYLKIYYLFIHNPETTEKRENSCIMLLFWFITILVYFFLVFFKQYIFILLCSSGILTIDVFKDIVETFLGFSVGITICIFNLSQSKILQVNTHLLPTKYTSLPPFVPTLSSFPSLLYYYCRAYYIYINYKEYSGRIFAFSKHMSFKKLREENKISLVFAHILIILNELHFILWFWVTISFLLAQRTFLCISC